jgi:hypothetical protein
MKNQYRLNDELACRYAPSTQLFDAKFLRLPQDERVALFYKIVNDCELARVFDWEPDKKNRQMDRDALDQAESAARHARQLAKYCREFPFQAFGGIVAGILESGVHLRIKQDQVPIERGAALGAGQSIRLANLLSALADEFEAGRILAKRWCLIHRTRYGPLNFPEPIENLPETALPGRGTTLAIYLSFLFRKHSLVGTANFQPGERIPDDGLPRWQLVTHLVQDSLGELGDVKDKASKVIRANPNLEIVGYLWGRQREQF